MMIFEIIEKRLQSPKQFPDLSQRFNNISNHFGGLAWAIHESVWIRERWREYFQLIVSLQNPNCDIVLRNKVVRNLMNEIWHGVRSRMPITQSLVDDIRKNGIHTPITTR